MWLDYSMDAGFAGYTAGFGGNAAKEAGVEIWIANGFVVIYDGAMLHSGPGMVHTEQPSAA